MPRATTTNLLNQLDELKSQFAPDSARRIQRLLDELSRKAFNDTDSLLQYHEALLFLRAYPQNVSIGRAAENELRGFANRVTTLRERSVDLAPLQHPEVSGIVGTSVIDTFSFYIVRWLLQRRAAQVDVYWDWFEDENRLAETWPRFMPLLEEDAFVEANIPYREWLRAARGRSSELAWLVERFDTLPRSEKERAELYDSQQLYVRWTPRFNDSRTGMREPARKLFYHRGPLIQRRDINLVKELVQPSPPLQKLNLRQGEKALDLARAASTVRYRELYGFTHGDPRHVYRAELGRGVELFMMGLPPDKRLPLRAYHAAMIYKNGVPIGYFEGLSLFERMESGFNLYYTFREGETAWLYARTLNVMRHFTGVTAFSLDPYQIGYENEEGIESGAFWFYRKLGFRPARGEILQLALKEEEKIARRKGYRTSAATLRRLAESPMIYELDAERRGDWDRFQVRKIGLKAQRQKERGLAAVLSLMPDLSEKQLLARIVRAKMGAEETTYLRLMQRHNQLRSGIIRLGS
ncbi:MAG TPA: hypothetical protein VJ875_21140 [Pyrinomonadaceae bacterium]|nr:hypothetical protein [Pyrinomonadaceae bacterium]